MVPKRLKLEHFTSYREPAELDLAGLNVVLLAGDNGAGKSSLLEAITWALWGKARSVSDDELISHGETDMSVELELEEDGRQYRVLRQRTRVGRGRTTLNFWSRSLETEEWLLQNGLNVRQTEEAISAALRLTYQTFINSVYLRQGHADEFTTKPPAERKRVLADILDLGRFDRLAEKAREEARTLAIEIRLDDSRLAGFEAAGSDETGLQTELDTAKKEALEIKAHLAKIEKELEPLRARLGDFAALKTQARYLAAEEERVATEQSNKQRQINGIQAEIAKRAALLKESAQITADYEHYLELGKKLETWRDKQAKAAELERQIIDLNHHREQLALRRAEQKKALVAEAEKIKERRSAQAERIKAKGECPLCLRAFSAEHSAEACIEAIREETRRELLPLKTNLPALDAETVEETNLAAKAKELETSKSAIGYNASTHQADEAAHKALNHIYDAWSNVKGAGELKAAKETQLAEAERELLGLKERQTSLESQRGELEERLSQNQPDAEALSETEERLRSVQSRSNTNSQTIGRLEAALEQLAARMREAKKLRRQQTERRSRLALLEEFAQACGKHGIQTLILEETLPILEERANDLLSELSGGAMTVTFETERQKKSGEGTIETLDILIADLEGTRPYELYSGGEAFRINIAIRVALSLLLAERAGAEVEFLIIDEGFGVLDQAGRDAVTGVLLKLRERFKKILVVTHLPEFKELFDDQILVYKDDSGSHLAMSA